MVVPEKKNDANTNQVPAPFDRFDVYGKANPKYNLFSVIDASVNNCYDQGVCGSVPEN